MSITRLFVDKTVTQIPQVQTFCSRLGLEPAVVDDIQAVYQAVRRASDTIAHGKQTLYLTRNQGAFMQRAGR